MGVAAEETAPAVPPPAAAVAAVVEAAAVVKPDDLTQLDGIGPKASSGALAAAGITTYPRTCRGE